MKYLGLVLILAGCGEPLVGSSYLGTELFKLGGVVVQPNHRIPAMHGALALSLFWIGGQAASDARVEQHAQLDSGFSEYSMTLFDPPPAGAAGFSDLLPGGELSIGVIVLYADKDTSGSLDLASDLLLGASADHVVVFASAPVSAGTPAAALLGELDAGYHTYRNDGPSSCRFVEAASCAPQGTLTATTGPVSLSLWPTAEEVVVPAPAARQGTIWTAINP